jgi:two-component system cell cycle sensor histidine kinase/response regulator CckA
MSEEHERLYEETRRRLRELMTLYEASQACLSISDQKGLLTAIIEAAARAADAALGSVMLIDEERGEYVFGAHYGLSQETITAVEAELHIPLGEGLAGTVVTTSRPVVVADVTTDPRWIPIETKEPIRSFLGVPLVGRDGRPLGALTLSHPETDAFDDDHARLLSTFANQAAMAIENARLYEQAQARSRYLETLQRINATLRSTLPLSQVLETIAQGAGEALNYVGSLILVPDATGERLTLGAVWGSRFLDAAVRLTGLEVGSFGLPLTANENPMARAYLRGELQAWSGEPERIVVGVEPPISPKLAPVIERVMGAKLAVCVPLPVGKKVVGVLVVFSSREQLPDEERAMLLGLADQAGLATDNAQLYEQAQHEIAERQRAIRALRESEERYRRLVELSFDVIAIHREGKIVYINAAGAELFGASSPEEVIGKTLLGFVHPDYSEIAKARMLQTSNGTMAPLIEEKLIRLDKTSVDTEVVEVPITYQGQPAVQVVARDITERKWAEVEVQRRLQEMTLLNQVTTVIASAADMTDALYNVCAELARFLQVPQADFATLNPQRTAAEVIADYHPPESPSAMGVVLPVEDNPSMAYVLEHKAPLAMTDAQTDPLLTPVHEIMRQRNARSILIVPVIVGGEVIGTLEFDAFQRRVFTDSDIGLVQHVASHVGQVLIRKQAEEALRESELQYRTTIDSMGDAIHVVDTDLQFILFNRAFKQWNEELGLGTDVLGRTIFEVFPFLADEVRDEYHQVFDTGKTLITEESTKVSNREFITETRKIPVFEGERVNRVVTVIRDITERKQAEEALRESEEKFRNLAEQSPNMIFINKGGRVVYANKKCEEIMGYAKEEFYSPDFDFLTLIAPESVDLVTANFNQHMKDEEVPLYEYALITKAGKRIEALYATRLIRYAGERAILGIVTDITERKRMEEALAQERDLLHALMDNIPDTIYFKDTASRFTRINRAQAQVLGLDDPKEAMGKTDFDFFTAEHAQDAHADEQGIVRSGQPLVDKVEQIRRADGQFRWVSATKVPIIDKEGQVTGIVGISRDITERKRAEEELRRLKEFNEGIVQSMTEGIIVENAEGCLTFVNPSAAALLGYNTPDELLGQHWTVVVPPDQQPIIQAAHERRVGGEADRYDVELTRRDGTRVSALISGSPRFEEGRFAGTLAVFTNITEQKKLEEQLRQAQKMEAIGTLAGGIAHDFNNLLTSILGFASVVHSELPADSPLRFDIETITRSARRGSELTRQLLAFARRGQVEVHPLSLNDMAREVIKLLERTIDKAIAIEPHLADDLPIVEGDAGQLHQMLLNLCLNARDAMPRGGQLIIETQKVTLSEEKTHTELDLEAGQYVLLSVTDTGIGMDAETQQRLFEPFFTTKEHGRGLGLAMVYGIVRGHGGAIHVYSEPGQGSTFKVYLPVAGHVTEDTIPEEVKISGGSETVLVVEDEESVRALLRRILKEGGYTVLLAANGAEAVERYAERSTEIDLVVLDIIMPQMGGRETYERLREINPEVKVLLSSGYSENGQAQDILAAGARGFLQKPYDLRAVLHSVRETLES